MSQQALAIVVERASNDRGFRAQLATNPDDALAEYDLTPEERAALLSGDADQIRSFGVDVRISKSLPQVY